MDLQIAVHDGLRKGSLKDACNLFRFKCGSGVSRYLPIELIQSYETMYNMSSMCLKLQSILVIRLRSRMCSPRNQIRSRSDHKAGLTVQF